MAVRYIGRDRSLASAGLSLVGLLVGLGGAAAVATAWRGGPTEFWLYGILGVSAGVGSYLWAYALARPPLLTPEDFWRHVEDPSRKIVLLLREFATDNIEPREFSPFEASVSSDEDLIVSAANNLGECVAIGRPGEPTPPKGALRVYADDDTWRDVVARLIRRADAILLRCGVSEHVLWEMEAVVDAGKLDRTVFVTAFEDARLSYAFVANLRRKIGATHEKAAANPKIDEAIETFSAISEQVYDDPEEARWAEAELREANALRKKLEAAVRATNDYHVMASSNVFVVRDGHIKPVDFSRTDRAVEAALGEVLFSSPA